MLAAPSASRRSIPQTSNPAPAKARTTALPIPPELPVTSTRSAMGKHLLGDVHRDVTPPWQPPGALEEAGETQETGRCRLRLGEPAVAIPREHEMNQVAWSAS